MSSNFFSQQDSARRNTRLLVVLFALAVLLLVLLTNLLVLVTLGFVDSNQLSDQYWHTLPLNVIAGISISVLIAVALAVLFKWLQLQAGGKVVAESLGGQRLSPASQDPLERRLLNVVEEMAIAAGTPVPPVYVLPEAGINAFAAGYSPADAVIGVTKGGLEQLNRDELQGVIAHEFSHILNGDMRMNIRLIAVLNGILFLGHIGYYILRGSRGSTIRRRSSNNKNGAGGILILGLGLVIIGYLGAFFGNLIKAAVSRQREFLADASAVQFTRNPRGIAGALKVIGSHSSNSKIANANADENSHLFFGEAISRWASIFATHPPLATRIKRLEPHWNGKFPSPRPKQQPEQDANNDVKADSGTGSIQTDLTAPATAEERFQQVLPLLLLHSSRQSEPAAALVCCMLLAQTEPQRTTQLTQIKTLGWPELLPQVDQLCDSVEQLNSLSKVQLLQRLIPALKTLPVAKFRQFEQLLDSLLNTAPEPDIGAWLAYQFVCHTVATQYDKKHIVNHFNTEPLIKHQHEIMLLLALVSRTAGDDSAQQQAWQQALQALAIENIMAQPELNYAGLNQAFSLLITLAPVQKQQLWLALEACVKADNLLKDDEKALLQGLALLLEMPYQAG